MKDRLIRSALTAGMIVLAHTVAIYADGGWLDQPLSFQSGWNTFWLEVDPEPNDVAALLSTVDYESIWTYQPGLTAEEPGRWIGYHKNKPDFVQSFPYVDAPPAPRRYKLLPRRAYLIKINSAGQTAMIKGRPQNRSNLFLDTGLNLFGADLNPNDSPTFAEFFADPAALSKVSAVFRLSQEQWTPTATGTVMQPRVGNLARVTQRMIYPGPFEVDVPVDGLQFAKRGYSKGLTFRVPVQQTSQSITVRALSSATPPAGQPADASGGNLSWLQYQDANDAQNRWKPLTGGVTVNIPAGQSSAQLTVRSLRANVPAPASIEQTNSLYQAIVEASNNQGFMVNLPIGMEVLSDDGVWVGQARQVKVSQQSALGGQVDVPVQYPLPMSLILKIPAAGSATLLKKATLLVDRDGRQLRYSYQSILFHQDVPLTTNATGWGGSTSLDANHALNPYRHRYQPEHTTGYTITRNITLERTETDPDPLNNQVGLTSNQQDNEIVGNYTEVIQGISLEPITVKGYFKLFRLGEIGDLQP